jgi:arylformamidase
MSRVIDLSMPLATGLRGVEIIPKFTVADNGWNASTLSLYSHAGTHMDAQVHFEAGPETIDQHTPSRCMGFAWLVNLAGIEPKALIECRHLGRAQKELRPGQSLVFRTDWNKFVHDPAMYRDRLPRISEELANWCVARKVKLLGVEPPSIADVNNLSEVTCIHKILLGGGVTIVEGLCNLDQITGPEFFFAALPLKIAGGDGCPCRAFAVDGVKEAEQLSHLLA